jgi:hypothetical protein
LGNSAGVSVLGHDYLFGLVGSGAKDVDRDEVVDSGGIDNGGGGGVDEVVTRIVNISYSADLVIGETVEGFEGGGHFRG